MTMDNENTAKLKDIFESVTGDTTVVETQHTESENREIEARDESEAVDAIDHHGFDDVIDTVEPADDPL